ESHLIVCTIASQVLEKNDILNIAKKLHFASGKSIFIGAGFPYTSIEKLKKSYNEAYTACFQLKSDNKRKYGFLKEASQQMDDMIADICECIEKGTVMRLPCFINNIPICFERWKEKNYI